MKKEGYKIYLWQVKKHIKIVAFSGIAILFYLFISATIAFPVSGSTHFTKKDNAEKVDLKTTDSSVLLCFSSRTKVNLTAPENNANPTLKKLSNAVLVPTKTTENLFKVVFSHYTFHSRNVLYRFSQIDMLYPFHHFW